MKETGRQKAFLSILLALMCIYPVTSTSLMAQDFQISASVSENRVFIGEQFLLSIEISGSTMRDVSLPVLPEINGVRVLSSTPSRSTSISIVNGRTTTSTTYTFTLIARDRGNFTIPPITVEIGGEQYSSNSLSVEIVERGQLSQEGRRQLPDIFLEVELDVNNPVPGQQIIASVVLYFKQGIEVSSFQPTTGWRTDGFWREELQNIRQPQAESVIIEGIRYRSAILMRYALFPTRSGELTIAAFPMNVGMRTQPTRNDPFGSFFGSGANQRRVTLESEPIILNVRPLPAIDNALTMNAVGDLRVNRRLSVTRVETGETLEMITRIEGTGNIPLIRNPGYSLPDGVELYTPQESSNIERRGLTISGDKTFTELMAPRAPGTYEIPAERVAVFDPAARRYRTITLPALTFEAVPSAQTQLASVSEIRSMRLQPVTGLAVWNNSTPAKPVIQTFWFWVLLLLPGAAMAAALKQRRLMVLLQNDKDFARSHRAYSRASDRFVKARDLVESGDAKEIYNTLHKTVTGFITDRLSLPEAGLSDMEILDNAKESGVHKDTLKLLKNILDKCATISYAPVGDRSDFRSDIIKTEKLIEELREQL
jgi:hypothetical protein